MGSGNNKKALVAAPPDEQLIGVFLQNQSKELEIKARELDLQKQTDDHSFEYAQQALSAQAEDRKASRTHNLESRKVSFVFVIIIVILVFVFLGFAIYSGKDAIALEVIRAVVYIGAGSGGGYAFGRYRKTTAAKEELENGTPEE